MCFQEARLNVTWKTAARPHVLCMYFNLVVQLLKLAIRYWTCLMAVFDARAAWNMSLKYACT